MPPIDRSHLFSEHSELTLRDWARRLRIFRFCRAVGGHANDSDTLEAAYDYASEAELRAFFAHIGVALVVHAAEPPKPKVGVPYSGDALAKFVSVIPGTKWIEQPRTVSIADASVFVHCDRRRIVLQIGTEWAVSEADVAAAETAETKLAGLPFAPHDPPRDTDYCISRAHYPDWFSG